MFRKASLLGSVALMLLSGCAEEETSGIDTARSNMTPLVDAACESDWSSLRQTASYSKRLSRSRRSETTFWSDVYRVDCRYQSPSLSQRKPHRPEGEG